MDPVQRSELGASRYAGEGDGAQLEGYEGVAQMSREQGQEEEFQKDNMCPHLEDLREQALVPLLDPIPEADDGTPMCREAATSQCGYGGKSGSENLNRLNEVNNFQGNGDKEGRSEQRQSYQNNGQTGGLSPNNGESTIEEDKDSSENTVGERAERDETEGFVTRMVHKVLSVRKARDDNGNDAVEDPSMPEKGSVNAVSSGYLTPALDEDSEEERSSNFVTKLKEKILPSCVKAKDEPNPEIFE